MVKLTDSGGKTREELTCIMCPKSCIIQVEKESSTGAITALDNAACRRGAAWVTQELLHPVRSVCSSVLVKNGTEPLAGVRTDRPVSKDDIFTVMEAIKSCSITAPVAVGETVIDNPGGIACRIIATRSVDRISE